MHAYFSVAESIWTCSNLIPNIIVWFSGPGSLKFSKGHGNSLIDFISKRLWNMLGHSFIFVERCFYAEGICHFYGFIKNQLKVTIFFTFLKKDIENWWTFQCQCKIRQACPSTFPLSQFLVQNFAPLSPTLAWLELYPSLTIIALLGKFKCVATRGVLKGGPRIMTRSVVTRGHWWGGKSMTFYPCDPLVFDYLRPPLVATK